MNKRNPININLLIDKSYRELKEKLHSYLKRFTKDDYLIEDTINEAFISVIEKFSTFNSEANFKTWIFVIARNKLKDSFRRRKEKRKYQYIEHEIYVFRIKKETFDASFIKKYINRLPKIFREPIELYYYKNYNYARISKIVNVPVNTVRTRIHRAKKKLKGMMYGEIHT